MVNRSYMFSSFLLQRLELNNGTDYLERNYCKLPLYYIWKVDGLRCIRPFLDGRMQQYVRDSQAVLE